LYSIVVRLAAAVVLVENCAHAATLIIKTVARSVGWLVGWAGGWSRAAIGGGW